MSYDSGFQTGAGIMQQAIARAQQQSNRKEDIALSERHRTEDIARQQPLQEVNLALDRKRLDQLSASLQAEDELRKRNARDLTIAEDSYQQFEQAANSIDWSQPDALKSYETLQRKHIPGITRNKSVMGKYDALNSAIMGSQDVTQRNAMLTSVADLRNKAISYGHGAEALAISEAVKTGKKSLEDATIELSDLVKYARDAETQKAQERAVELRKAPVEARVEGELQGAYGGSDVPKMDDVTKAQLRAHTDTLAELNKQISQIRLKGAADEKTQALLNSLNIERRATIREMEKLRVQPRRGIQAQTAAKSAPQQAAQAPSNLPAKEDAARLAQEAIQRGKDPAAVRARFRELYGEDLP